MTPSSDAARTYSRAQSDTFLEQLYAMLRIPSLSGDPAHKGDITKMADLLVKHMRDLGLQKTAAMPTAGLPVAYGEWMGAGPDAPTILVYGHYDVVPALMEDGWETDPFEPVIKDGRIYARGATDDKGQMMTHVNALESYLKTTGSAPVNVKFLLEGEEEVSSPNLAPFIRDHLDLLKADVCLVSDTSMPSIEAPAITHSLRGMTYIQIDLEGPKDDLHSGLWGGAAHNPALALVEILGKLYNPDNIIAVPGFYDDVVPLTEEEREMIAKTDMSEEQYKATTGVPAMWGDKRFTIRERLAARPTLDINGMWSGWAGPGPKTIIPSKAGAKLSSRLVANQDPQKIFQKLKQFIESITPDTVKLEIQLLTEGRPALIPFDIPEMQAAARAYKTGWGYEPVFTRGGGSIPVVADIGDMLKIPVVMMGYGLDSDGLHSPNESYSIEMFQRGIETAIVYLDELAQLPS